MMAPEALHWLPLKCSLRVEFEGAAVHTPREKTSITTLVNLPSLGDVIQSGRVYIILYLNRLRTKRHIIHF